MQALHDVVKAGYARYIGMSSCHAYQCASMWLCAVPRVTNRPPAQSMQCRVRTLTCTRQVPDMLTMPAAYAIQNKLTPFISMQNHHSLIYREEEREMFPTLKVRALPSSSLQI